MRVETDVEKMRRTLLEVGEDMGDTADEPPLPEIPDDPPGTMDRPQKYPCSMRSPLMQRTVAVRS